MGWFYILCANVFIGVVLYFGLGKYGNIRIGGPTQEPEFSDFSWLAMLFSAGMGIGLMFWSVGEPIWHYSAPPFGEAETAAAAETSMVATYYHWGIHPWAIYGLVALGLAFYAYNRGLPLTFRSLFWPLLGERIYDWPGHLVDTLAVFATVFGLATSLGLGAGQINAGLNIVSGQYLGTAVPVGTTVQVVLIAVITSFAVVSVWAGLDKGVRRLSQLNVYLMFTLLGVIVIIGPTLFIFDTFVQTLGSYLNRLPELAFWTASYEGGSGGWQASWTIFYWGWWIAWSPFVGMFIARISKGRTVREFVLAVLLLPALFSFIWMSAFGGTALHFELFTQSSIIEAVQADEAVAMFELFALLPLTLVLSAVAMVLVVSFFVTSSDSGSLVLGSITAGGQDDATRNLRVSWAVFEGILAAVLLIGGGLGALQTASIATGLPFAFVLLFICYTLWVGLASEYRLLQSREVERRIRSMDDDVLPESMSGPSPTDDD
ncbi:choline/carnitine/betaine transporter [Halalkalicoccus jeotgali B3]|uniref:Choline/carnitine/betaine transporter n=1 Tax=Halalkalicoccus jeotgali (strain DSM 18796 / CECT 7217 / JCM 14584 / KCTC 4019 / B3) TaxID=795797 RepID=D8J434_HALJB|nr:BCCT family transporter [Halalkalicoccus jeotgali]ADJ15426.1 choline/carnitine/betaine transporter [Halalkalicoccus jeotgali B3]ELY35798.1 choline/carnitine/betaine transporter [Halalkalicoccus jeotgali B3]